MGAAIRKHLRDFIAVAGLCVISLITVYVILQQQHLRIPVLEEKPFTLKAEFETAQAVTPGQGQTVVVAGVKIGDISQVELKDGKAVVTMNIERKFLPIYRNATALIRPRTGLQDVFVELDPGTRSAGEFKSGDTIPLKNTEPEVNLDQILQALDKDTQAYLRTLIVGAGQGLKGQSRNLGRVLGGLGPINHELAKLNREVGARSENLRHLIHNLNLLTGAIAQHGSELTALVSSSNRALGAIAREDSHVQEAVRLLPGTLATAHDTLNKTLPFAQLLGPTFNNLRPFARNLDRVNASTIRVAATKPAIKHQIRPFVRAARAPVRNLRPAARRLARATPRLTDIGIEINRLGNMAAYNPGGANPPGSPNRDEGYLYWLAWLSHDADSVFQAGDSQGFYRRFIVTQNCATALSVLGSSPLQPVISGLAPLSQALSGNPSAPCS
jgi:phospholipid/cholesterol/gamma-HCH transport system substrate-binding protein